MAQGRQPSHYQKEQREAYRTSETISEAMEKLRPINNGILWPTPSTNIEQQSHEGAIDFSFGQSAVFNTHVQTTRNSDLSRPHLKWNYKNRGNPYLQSVQKSQHGTTSRSASTSIIGPTLTKSPKVHDASGSKHVQVNTHRSDGACAYEVGSKMAYTDANPRKADFSLRSNLGSHRGRTSKETCRSNPGKYQPKQEHISTHQKEENSVLIHTSKMNSEVATVRQTGRTSMKPDKKYTTTAQSKTLKPMLMPKQLNTTAKPTSSSNLVHSSRTNRQATVSSKKISVPTINSKPNPDTYDAEATRVKAVKDGSKLEHFTSLQQEDSVHDRHSKMDSIEVKPQRQEDSSSTINFANCSGETGNAASFSELDTKESRQEQENMDVSTSDLDCKPNSSVKKEASSNKLYTQESRLQEHNLSSPMEEPTIDPSYKPDSIEERQTEKHSTGTEVESGQSIQENFNSPRLEEHPTTGGYIQTNSDVPDIKLQRTDSNPALYLLLNSGTQEGASHVEMIKRRATQEPFNAPESQETFITDDESKMDTSEANSPGTSSLTTHSLTKDKDAKLNKTGTPGRRNENENINLPIKVSIFQQPNSTMDNNISEEITQGANSTPTTYTGLDCPIPAKVFTSRESVPMEVDDSIEEVVQSQQPIRTAQNQPRKMESVVSLKSPNADGNTVTLNDIQHEEAIDKLNTKDLKALLLSSGIKSSEINGAEKSFLLSLAKRLWTDKQKASTPSQITETTRGFHNSKDEAVPEKHSEHSETHSKPKITDDIYNVQTLSDITSEDIIKKLKPRIIKEILSKHGKKCDNIVEKDELQNNLLELWRNTTGTEQLQKIAKHATSEGASQTIHGNKNPSSSRFGQDQSEKISGEQISKDANRTTQNIPNPRNSHTIREDKLTNRQSKTTTDISNVKILADITSFASIEALGVHEIKEILFQHRVNFSNISEKKDLEKRLLTLWQNSKRTNEKSPKTLADITSEESIRTLSNREIKDILKEHGVDFSNLVEKIELEKCLKSLWEDTKKGTTASTRKHCLICKKETSNCILLNCGHLVTCKQCGFSVKECPVCHQYVVRAVQVFSV